MKVLVWVSQRGLNSEPEQKVPDCFAEKIGWYKPGADKVSSFQGGAGM